MEAGGGVAIFTTTRRGSVFHPLTLQSSVVAHCVCLCVYACMRINIHECVHAHL